MGRIDGYDYIDISFKEISIYETEIYQIEHIVSTSSSPNLFKVEFSVKSEGFDSEKEVACVFLTTAPIGSHIFGILVVLVGIVSEKDDPLSNEDLVSAVEEIENKYDKNYSVVTMFELN
ncbi:MAG: hypothetical protein GQ475_07390 [Methylococcaceae bacterium]|nr:hypothetical protein [Methylococcaceae bacterium]